MDHTLIVPTYNRNEHLARLLNYYFNVCAEKINVIVLDSSCETVKEKNRKLICEKYKEIKYLAYDENIPMAKKICQGLNHVNTQYVSFCGDDDLIFPSAISTAISILIEENEVVAAHGIYINFNLTKSSNACSLTINKEYSCDALNYESMPLRIFNALTKYESTFYAVYRTNQIQEIFDVVKNIPSLHFQELFQTIGSCILGKVKRFDEFYGARQSCEAAEPSRTKWQTLYWFADDQNEIMRDYLNYLEISWQFYSKNNNKLNRKEFEKIMNLAHASYFSISKPHIYFKSILSNQYFDCKVEPTKDLLLKFRTRKLSDNMIYIRLLKRLKNIINSVILYQIRKESKNFISTKRQLEVKARELTGQSFECNLNLKIHWLVMEKKFQTVFLELCKYSASRDIS